MKRYHFIVRESDTILTMLQYLTKKTNLSEQIISDACEKGACFIQKGSKGKILRQRQYEMKLSLNDKIFLNYDPKVLSTPWCEDAQKLFETKNYGIWYKEVGVLTQGSEFSDHSSLLHYLERSLKKQIYLIHRLDRETCGPVIFAYNSKAAHLFSELFKLHKIEKTYHAIVKGKYDVGFSGNINQKLDGKEAHTWFLVKEASSQNSALTVKISSGRLHQIRRHLDMCGMPIMGDSKYGKQNKSNLGLQLEAISLKFIDPFTNENVSIDLTPRFSLKNWQ